MSVLFAWTSRKPVPSHIDRSNTARMDLNRHTQTTSRLIHAPAPRRPVESTVSHDLDQSCRLSRPFQEAYLTEDMTSERGATGCNVRTYDNRIHQLALQASSVREFSCQTCGQPDFVNVVDDPSTRLYRIECSKCRQRKASHPSSQRPLALLERPLPPLPPSSPEGSTTTLVNLESSPDKQHNASIAQRKTCHKCGKNKKTDTLMTNSNAMSNTNGTPDVLPSRHIARQHTMYKSSKEQLQRFPTGVPRRKPVPSRTSHLDAANSNMDFTAAPPTLTSNQFQLKEFGCHIERGSSSLDSNVSETTPTPRRTRSISSIASSISAKLSNHRRKSRKRRGSFSQTSKLSLNLNHEPGQLIDVVTKAMGHEDSPDRSKLDDEAELDSRSESSFSFAEWVHEDEVQLSGLPQTDLLSDNMWHQANVAIKHTNQPGQRSDTGKQPAPRLEQWRISSSVIAMESGVPLFGEEEMFLIQHDQAPEITRFKSLRNGVQRAGSLARSESLKRLNSLKRAPQFWYRADMMIEGTV